VKRRDIGGDALVVVADLRHRPKWAVARVDDRVAAKRAVAVHRARLLQLVGAVGLAAAEAQQADVVEAFDLSPPRRAARTADALHPAGSPHGARDGLASDDRDRIAHARYDLRAAMSVIEALEAAGALEHADRISRHDVDRIDHPREPHRFPARRGLVAVDAALEQDAARVAAADTNGDRVVDVADALDRAVGPAVDVAAAAHAGVPAAWVCARSPGHHRRWPPGDLDQGCPTILYNYT